MALIDNYDLSLIEQLEQIQSPIEEDILYHLALAEEDLEESASGEIYDLAIVLNSNVVIFASELGYLSFPKSHAYYDKANEVAINLLDDEKITTAQWKVLEDNLNEITGLRSWSNGRLSIEGNTIKFDNDSVPIELEDHLLTLYRDNTVEALEAWSKFMSKLIEASHVDTYNRLYSFLKYNDLSITEEGNVLAWKVVRPDFKDKHSGTLDNSVGATVTMPRVKVTHDPSVTCSNGLHACAFGYLQSFASHGDPVVLVEIDVRDIVSVPVDYDGKKIRCCKYVVKKQVGIWGQTIDANTDLDSLED